MNITLPVCYYQPTPTSNPRGIVQEIWTLDAERTAFISLHSWNVGTPDGTPVPEQFWVDMGSPGNHEWAGQVTRDAIYPCLMHARALGMPVVHVQSPLVARHYPHLMPPMPEAAPSAPDVPERIARTSALPPVTDDAGARAQKVHGAGYMQWEGWDALDVPAPVKPIDGETMVVDTDQFDLWLRRRGIDTLLYTGFCTNLCILDAPAAMKPMAGRGYRCVIFREATAAVEFPETFEAKTNAWVALRYIECWVGYTASTLDFLRNVAPTR